MDRSHPSPPPVEAVVFDWGGTLTPWHVVDMPEQWRVFAREVHGIPFGSEDLPESDLRAAEDLAARILAVEDAAWKRGRVNHESARLEDILTAAGVDPDHDRHHLALAAYRGYWEPHTYTDSQVRPLWEALRRSNIRIGVLSNTIWTRSYHRGIFERDGVLDLIDADLYSSELPRVKPHPEAFEAICSALDVAPPAAVYVGDRLFEDVHGPQQIGMRAIWIPHSDIPEEQRVAVDATPDAIVHDLLDILDVLEGWG